MNASEILRAAREREASQVAQHTSPDYPACNVIIRKQKSALTRAVNSGDTNKIILTCRKTVEEWSHTPFYGWWPDDWSRWQRALDDALGFGRSVRLENL